MDSHYSQHTEGNILCGCKQLHGKNGQQSQQKSYDIYINRVTSWILFCSLARTIRVKAITHSQVSKFHFGKECKLLTHTDISPLVNSHSEEATPAVGEGVECCDKDPFGCTGGDKETSILNAVFNVIYLQIICGSSRWPEDRYSIHWSIDDYILWTGYLRKLII